MGRRSSSVGSSFYCLNCGNKGIPLSRPKGFQRSQGHRKRLYCIHCRCDVNHVECRNWTEEQEFKTQFAAGAFKEEAAASLAFLASKALR